MLELHIICTVNVFLASRIIYPLVNSVIKLQQVDFWVCIITSHLD